MDLNALAIPPPEFGNSTYKKNLLCGPGPCDISEEVKAAMLQQIITPVCPATHEIFEEIRKGLQYVFQTKSKLVLAMSGSGHAGMEAVVCNLLGRGQTILFASRGEWDRRAKNVAQRYGVNHVEIKCSPNTVVSQEDIELALKQHRPDALFLVQGDSSTGSIQELRGLGPICRKYGALLIVDAVVTIGAVPFLMDEWQVDAVYTALQKGLGGPAGISPVAFGPRAEAIVKNRRFEPPFYFDVKLLAEQWNCYDNVMTYHHTESPPLLHALRCCLKEVAAETLPVRWARHEAAAKRFYLGLSRLPVQYFIPNPAERFLSVTTLMLPKGYDYSVVVRYMRDTHDIIINAGLGVTAGKILRIGLLAMNATEAVADKLVEALEDCLKQFSHQESKL